MVYGANFASDRAVMLGTKRIVAKACHRIHISFSASSNLPSQTFIMNSRLPLPPPAYSLNASDMENSYLAIIDHTY